MKTLLLIKPNATAKNQIGKILTAVEDDGFVIQKLKLINISTPLAKEFYAVHKERPFFEPLVNFMTSGKVVAAVLQAQDAVAKLRTLVGATDPAKADAGTIRALYGDDLEKNAVHASDSPENALTEISIIF